MFVEIFICVCILFSLILLAFLIYVLAFLFKEKEYCAFTGLVILLLFFGLGALAFVEVNYF